jgi:hypothetical protein
MMKGVDPQIVNPILTGFIEEVVTSKGGLLPTKTFDIAAKPIEEYEGRMVVHATDKFDVPTYVAATNFYLNQGDMHAHRPRGAMVVYVDIEVADKIFKAAGLEVPYDEDDGSMEALCGSFCQLIVDALKDRLAAAGFIMLEASTPIVYKNTILEGVPFSKDQNEKQELSFYFLKHKALVIEWTLALIPQK